MSYEIYYLHFNYWFYRKCNMEVFSGMSSILFSKCQPMKEIQNISKWHKRSLYFIYKQTSDIPQHKQKLMTILNYIIYLKMCFKSRRCIACTKLSYMLTLVRRIPGCVCFLENSQEFLIFVYKYTRNKMRFMSVW